MRFARDHGGPVATAVALALIAVIPTAMTVYVSSGPAVSIDGIERQVPTPVQGTAVVLVTLVTTAVIAGAAGGWLRRRFRLTGATAALVLAWLLGALLLPFVAAALAVPLQIDVMCFDTCGAMLDAASPTSALLGVVLGMVIVVLTVGGGLVALAFAFGGIVLGRRGHPTGATASIVVAFGVLNAAAFLLFAGLFVPYVCLAAGVVAWDRWLAVRAERAAPMAEASAPRPAEGG